MSEELLYVVYWCERLRDGVERGSEVVGSLQRAIEIADDLVNSFGGRNTTVRIFKIGEEVEIVREIVEERAESVKTTIKYKVK